ncbi:MAG: hypothetical protein AAGC60_18370 [Acidobacteriota bacterium]
MQTTLYRRRPAVLGTFWTTLFAALTLLLCAGSAQAAGPLFHVEIEDGEDTVSIQMPLALVQAAVAVLPDDLEIDGEIKIDDTDFEVADLHAFWQAVKTSPEDTLLRVDSDHEKVTVSKRGDMLLLQTLEGRTDGTRIDAEIPFAVVDALFSGSAGRLDLSAALGALAEMHDGPILSIREGGDTVRLWVEPDSTR